MWSPELPDDQPIYLAIADALAADIAAGSLKAGDRLPTHRELAETLGVTVGTVTRAYAEARRRTLVHGEVGRGTFVQHGTLRLTDSPQSEASGHIVDCALNCPAPTTCTDEIRAALVEASAPGMLESLLRYSEGVGRPHHRARVARWLSRRGVSTTPDQVLITTGAQQGILIALGAVCRQGEVVLVESLTYMGVLSAARFLGIRLEPVAIDTEGAIPEAFAEACRRHKPRAFYCMPTMQNPTATVMPVARREAIAEIARENGVAIFEDDIHSFLHPDPLPSVAVMAGDLGYYITGVSKSAAGGLRVGFLRVPSVTEAMTQGMWATTIMAPPLLVEVATQLLESGAIDGIESCRREEARERQGMARTLLGDWIAEGVSEHSQFLWLDLPPGLRPEAFAAKAEAAGIRVAPSYTFSPVPSRAPAAIRVSLVHEARVDNLRRGLESLRDLLAAGPAARVLGV